MIQAKTFGRSTIAVLGLLLFFLRASATTADIPLSCSISGSTVSCVNQLEYYYTGQTAGNSYTWTLLSGGTLSSTNSASAMVNWTQAGTHQLLLSETTASGAVSVCSLLVTVFPRPAPRIFTDLIADCQDFEGEDQGPAAALPKGECWLVCENTPISYWTTEEAGYSYQWTAVGGTPVSASGSSVSVVWGSTGPGSIILTVTSPGGCTESKTQCVKIIATPKAAFTFNNQSPDSPLKICRDETVYFTDQSIGASQWFWTFGDGTSSTLQNPAHVYPGPGSYFGSLMVKNNCGCFDVLNFTVIVQDLVSPEIGCISTLCLGDCAFYTVTNINNCPGAVVDWRVFGGAILTTPVNGSVSVIWDDNDGYIDQNGHGLICVRITGCEGLCDGDVCVQVPIIHQARIHGPTEVCAGERVSYDVAAQPGINEQGSIADGVDFDWVVSGSGYIVSNPPYSNSITVEWYGSGSGTVSLNGYENYLGDPICSYNPSPLGVNIKAPFTLTPEETKTCAGQTVTINSSGSGSFNWTINGPGGVVGPVSGGNAYAVPLPLAGTYIVTAQSTSGQYCPITPSAHIVANPQPPAPTGQVTGVTAICPNTPYVYSISTPPPPGCIYVWTAIGGTVYGGGGQSVSVQWSGVGSMKLLVKSKSNLEPFCESLASELNIGLYSPPATFINGPASSCINQTASYDALALSNFTDIQWSIIPATAASVISGQGTQNITVLFNNNASGTVQIVANAKVCGTTVSDSRTVTVNQVPVISIVSASSACEDSPVSLSVSPNTGIVSYNWNFGDGTSSTLANPTHSWGSAGSFPISVQANLNICGNPTLSAATSIQINPSPVAYITASNGYEVCPGLGISTDLTVSTQFACNYSWSTSASGPVITVSNGGVYWVTATEPGTGCSVVGGINILECGSGGGNPCVPVYGPWTFTASEHCDTYTFTPNPTPALFLGWSFGDGFGSSFPGTVSHTYEHVGHYQVILFSLDPISQCTLFDVHTVDVRYKGNFSANFNCGSGAMLTTLTDRSEYLPGVTGTQTWYDGTTLLGTGAVLSVPLGPGLHNIYLEVNIGGMICSTLRDVTVPGMPQANFVHNAPKCEEIPVQFFNSSSGGGISNFNWNFGDGSGSALQNPRRVYDAPPGAYTVTLTVSNNWGCSSSISKPISIFSKGANPTLSLSPATPVCSGTPVVITASSALPSPVNYTWFNASEPSVPLQGPSTLNSYSAYNSGLYGVLANDGNGCKYNVLAPQPVVVTPPPYLNISGNTDLCVGVSFNLSADIGPGFSYQWTIVYPDGFSTNSSSAAISVYAGSSGVYAFSVTVTNNSSGCSNTGSTNGTAHPGITDLSISASGTCVPAQLIANGTGIASYNWSEGSTSQQILALQGGQYAVVASDQWGCTAKEEIYVSGPPDLSNVMVGCYEFCSPAIWQAPYCAGCSYQWTLNGSPIAGANGASYKIGESGVYTVIVTNAYGCQSESAPIEVSVVKEGNSCHACDVKITQGNLVCRGTDPATGQRIYEFWLDVHNNGGALYGTTIQSDLGTVQVDFPPDGFIPGGGLVTQVHGFLLWNGQKDFGCFDLLGYLNKDCSDLSPCSAQWCGELSACCSGNCALKITEVKAVCLGNGYYRVSGTVTNGGCDLFGVYVQTVVGNFPLNPSTILGGNSQSYSGIIKIPPGTYTFQVCGKDAGGQLCCQESKIKIPACNPNEVCALDVKKDQFACDGLTEDGFQKYNFSFSVFGVPAGYSLQLVPLQPGYILSSNYVCSGAQCTISGSYVDFSEPNLLCFGVVAINPAEPKMVCIGEICVKKPKCGGKPLASKARNQDEHPLSLEADFFLVPNPASATVQLWFGSEAPGAIEVSLNDLLGKKIQVLQQRFEKGIQLDLSGLPSGLYIVSLKNADGVWSSKKLAVEK